MHLSDFISENMESIVQAWEDFARTIEPPALTMDRTALRDHASAMLKSNRHGSHGRANGDGAQTEPVTVHLESDSDEIIARIKNKGVPIDREKMQSIFEPLVRFTEEDSMGHANESSFGIGLYITREIVQAHKGVILVDSSHSEGTIFTVRLPRTPVLESDCSLQ